MFSTTNSDNLRYYDMSDDKEVNQCRFTWNWEMDDRLNTYVPLVVMRILNLVNDCIILYL